MILALAILTSLALSCSRASTVAEGPAMAGISEPHPPRGTVLFLLSSASEQELRNGKKRPTGTFLSEFYEPYRAVIEDGYEVAIATPKGLAPVIDPEGMKNKYWENESVKKTALSQLVKEARFQKPLSFDEALARVDLWEAIVIPGGQGVMLDVVVDPRAHQLVLDLARRNKAIGLICHAPALLKHLPQTGNPLAARAVTAVSPFEEFFIETFIMGGKAQDRRLGRQLRRRGYDYDSALPKADYAVRDCNLVTSQNPFSGSAFLREFRWALMDAREGIACTEERD